MKISINLLPEKLRSTEKIKARLLLAKKTSIGFLVLMVVLTAVLFVYVFLESLKIKSENQTLEVAKSEIEKYKEQESLAAVLKERLNSINTISQTVSTQNTTFNLLTKITPPDIKVKSLSVDKTTHSIISIETQSTKSLDVLFNNLTDPKLNDGKISGTKLETLSRSQAGIYKGDLNINIK